jgi:hypothetical protein
MAYPTVSAAYGLLAVNRVDGLPYAGAIRQIPIASTYNTPIYYGDIVRIAAGGTIEKSTVTTDSTTAAANNTVGVFVGCSFTNSQSQPVSGQYYQSNTANQSAVAFVVDDPLALFKVAVTLSNGAMSSVNQSIVGTNMAVVQGTGSNTTGDSVFLSLQPLQKATQLLFQFVLLLLFLIQLSMLRLSPKYWLRLTTISTTLLLR